MTNDEWVGLGALAGVGGLLYAVSSRAQLEEPRLGSVFGDEGEFGITPWSPKFKLFSKATGGNKWWRRSAEQLSSSVVSQLLGDDKWMYPQRWKKSPCKYQAANRKGVEVLGRPSYRRYPGNWCHVAYQQVKMYRKATEGGKTKAERAAKKAAMSALKSAGIPTGAWHMKRLEKKYNRKCADECNAPYIGKSGRKIKKRDARRARRKRWFKTRGKKGKLFGSVVNHWLINHLPERERDQLVQLIEDMGRDPNYLAPVMSSMDRDWNIWKWVHLDGGTFTYTGTAWSYAAP
jgi:hypothetical protein